VTDTTIVVTIRSTAQLVFTFTVASIVKIGTWASCEFDYFSGAGSAYADWQRLLGCQLGC